MKPLLLLAAIWCLPACAADVCIPRSFAGTYGFQLSGVTTISGNPKPTVSLGTLTFQEDTNARGSVNGYSSTQFAGFLLGNPITGPYEAHTDCTLTWSLQDDSGNFRHFSGTMSPISGGSSFAKTDPGAPDHGLMLRTPDSCGANTLQPHYRFTIAGAYIPMEEGQHAHSISASGTVDIAADGKLHITANGKSARRNRRVTPVAWWK